MCFVCLCSLFYWSPTWLVVKIPLISVAPGCRWVWEHRPTDGNMGAALSSPKITLLPTTRLPSWPLEAVLCIILLHPLFLKQMWQLPAVYYGIKSICIWQTVKQDKSGLVWAFSARCGASVFNVSQLVFSSPEAVLRQASPPLLLWPAAMCQGLSHAQ